MNERNEIMGDLLDEYRKIQEDEDRERDEAFLHQPYEPLDDDDIEDWYRSYLR